MLAKNSFGRSALTEAFAGGNVDLAKLMLSHSSAEDDKLLSSTNVRTDADGNEVVSAGASAAAADAAGASAPAAAPVSVVHEFALAPDGKGTRVSVRELEVAREAEDVLGAVPSDDTTGLALWAASVVLGRWIADPAAGPPRCLDGAAVVELGAGCGLPGLAARAHRAPKRVLLTDLHAPTLDNLRHNAGLNGFPKADVRCLDWADPSAVAPSLETASHRVAVGADLVYHEDCAGLLADAVAGLLGPRGGTFLYCAPDDGRAGLARFVDAVLPGKGFALVSKTAAPQAYAENPFASRDDDLVHLYLNELLTMRFLLYEFALPPRQRWPPVACDARVAAPTKTGKFSVLGL